MVTCYPEDATSGACYHSPMNDGSLLLPIQPGPPAIPVPDAESLAARLGCSVEAVRLTRSCELIDLHIDTFIPPRLWGYDILTRHRGGPLGRFFFGHLDLPRMFEGGMNGACWSITTNPLRGAKSRWRTFSKNLARLQSMIEGSQGIMVMARTEGEYREARRRGAHACFLSIQGGNALEAAPLGVASLPGRDIVRVTLVHLTDSVYGATSSPLGFFRRNKHLSTKGADFVRQLNSARIFVDLAHIHETAFWDAVEVHDKSQPLLATHTGVSGVVPHWRNLTDAQLKAIADTGGTVGIIFSGVFTRRPGAPSNADMLVDHMEHIRKVVGEDHVSIGSDYDGAISPPPDLAGGDMYPNLVERMLRRGWSEGAIAKALGDNFLRCLKHLRGGVISRVSLDASG